MKSIKRIILRNIFTASGTVILVLIINTILYYSIMGSLASDEKIMNGSIQSISDGFSINNNNIDVTHDSLNKIEKYFDWAMILNDDGNVIWSKNLPSELNKKYTSSDIASFTRWYLNDFPVDVWANDCGLLVLGSEKDSLWKHDLRMNKTLIRNLPLYIILFFITNIILSIILTFISSIKFFKSLKQVAQGVNDIANNKPVNLNIKGDFKNLADDINKTSKSLIKQQNIIDKRDNARNNWIIGVSHDIRTPLSMIMGYASVLENNDSLNEKDKKQASIIRSQSKKINDLINDLNLTVKLEYEMQPFNTKPIYICEILRKVCVDYLNNFNDEKYTIELNINDDCNESILNGDERLLQRVFSNLIGNSINHNTQGCNIIINVYKVHDKIHIEILDDGTGFTNEKINELNNSTELPTGKNHGLGLFIVKQIIETHDGEIIFGNNDKGVKINIKL